MIFLYDVMHPIVDSIHVGDTALFYMISMAPKVYSLSNTFRHTFWKEQILDSLGYNALMGGQFAEQACQLQGFYQTCHTAWV